MLKIAAYTLAIVSTLAASIAGIAMVNAMTGGYPIETQLLCVAGMTIGMACCIVSLIVASEH